MNVSTRIPIKYPLPLIDTRSPGRPEIKHMTWSNPADLQEIVLQDVTMIRGGLTNTGVALYAAVKDGDQ